MAFDTPLNTNDQSFDRVLRAGLPVLTLISGGAPDSSLDDALKQVAKADSGNLLVARVRAEENPGIVRRYGVRGSTLLTFKDADEQTRAEVPTASDVRAHADFLLGRGAKPQPRPSAPPTQTSDNGHGASDGHPLHVTDATFARDVLDSPLPVMVDFWAEWCGPCRMIAPALEKLAGQYAGKVRIAKLNVDENQRTAMQYQVQSIPTLLLVKQGKIVDRVVGALPEPQLRAQLERLLRN